MVNVSTKAWKVDSSSSKMFIDPATPVSINDLLYGLMVQSGNDAARWPKPLPATSPLSWC
jgi:D-alanyl-D-alanine carboxypeptidase (penicillin-binding protein 5/6)